jgi:hypothetical protein
MRHRKALIEAADFGKLLRPDGEIAGKDVSVAKPVTALLKREKLIVPPCPLQNTKAIRAGMHQRQIRAEDDGVRIRPVRVDMRLHEMSIRHHVVVEEEK